MKVQIHLFLSLFCLLLLSCCDDGARKSVVVEQGVTNKEILLGSSSALSGHAGFLGTQYLRGAQILFNETNANGGVHGRRIKTVSYDDQYNPTKTIANTQRLISQDKVFALFNYVGTPTSVSVKETIKQAGIPIFGFFTGAENLRSSLDSNIFHLRDSYYSEAEGAVELFVDSKGFKKIGVLYQEDAFGQAVLKGIQLSLKRRNLEPVVTDTFVRGSMDMEDALNWIYRKDVDVIMMVGTYAPLAKFINESHKQGKTPYFSTVSFVGSTAFSNELINVQDIVNHQYNKIIVTQVVPSPYSKNYKATSEYIALSKKYFPDDVTNYVAFEGYLNAKVIVEALHRAGKNLTRDGFIEAISSLGDLDLGIDKKVNYQDGKHQGFNGIYYSHLTDAGWFETFTPGEVAE